MCALIQTNLRFGAVWSNSSMGAFRIVSDAKFRQAGNEYFDQIAKMHRLIWIFGWAHMQEIMFPHVVPHLMAALFDNVLLAF